MPLLAKLMYIETNNLYNSIVVISYFVNIVLFIYLCIVHPAAMFSVADFTFLDVTVSYAL